MRFSVDMTRKKRRKKSSLRLTGDSLVILCSPVPKRVTAKMQFCPQCANTLQLRMDPIGNTGLQYHCNTCPYIYRILRSIKNTTYMERKQVDDVLGGEKAWENVDSIDETCPKCEHARAYYMQIQTRSADEPMTTFYKCANHVCGYHWREK